MSVIQSISQNNYILQAPPPSATMFTTALEYDGDKISGYAGSAFAVGGSSDTGTYIDYYNKPSTSASQVRASGSSLLANDIRAYASDTGYFQITPVGFNAIYAGTAYATLNPGGLTAVGLSATTNSLNGTYITANATGLYAPALTAVKGTLSAVSSLSANQTKLITPYAELNNYSFNNGVITAGTEPNYYFPYIESSGSQGHLYINSAGCRYTDNSGNIIWDALAANTMSAYSQNTPIFICPGTKDFWPSMSASAPYMSADNLGSLTWKYAPANFEVVVSYTGITTKNVGITANSADIIASGVSLTGLYDAIHSSMIEGDSATSSISAIAGSAIDIDTSNLLTVNDASAFYTTANESGFITGVDLTPYQTTAGMTAYQEAGDYYSASNPSAFITQTEFTAYTASVIPTQLVATSAEATGTNILYVVTGE